MKRIILLVALILTLTSISVLASIGYSWEFNDGGDGFCHYSYNCNLSVSGGKYNIDVKKDKQAIIYSYGLSDNVLAAYNTHLYLDIKSDYDCLMQVYFITDTDTVFNESKKLRANISAGEDKYVIDMSANENWSGYITKIRIDFLNHEDDNIALIDYIRFGGEPAQLPDDSEVKLFLNDKFLRQMDSWDGTGVRKSGWDLNKIGGSVLSAGYLQLSDTSNTLPVTASHDIEPIFYGKVNMEFALRLSGLTNGAYIELNNGIRLETINSSLYLKTGVANDVKLTSITLSANNNIKVVMDYDNGVVDVYCNGSLKASDVKFSNDIAADNVFISTGEAATGSFVMPSIRIYRGYPLWEDSTVSLSTTPIKHNFDAISRSFIYEEHIILPTAANFRISFNNGESSVFNITTDRSSFYANSGSETNKLYDYKANMWYILRAEFNRFTQTVDVKLNGRYIMKDIKIDFDSIDNITLTSDNTRTQVSYLKLFYDEYFDDYVPEPKPVSSSEYLIGMQSFPIFTEGTSVGWDWINDTPGRKPLLGWYDGSSPETADWTIKWMVEHGVNFQWFCWHGFGQLGKPVQYYGQDPTVQEGYMNAKYSDYIKYGILWENSAVNVFGSDIAANKEHFLTYTAPYWIEYFLKDPRYIKVNGRPLIGVFDYWKLSDSIGGETAVFELLKTFRQMCIDEGVGNPIIVFRVGAENAYAYSWVLTRFKNSGGDAFYLYGNADRAAGQKHINIGLLNNIASSAPGVQYIPTYNASWDSFSWLKGTGFKLTKDEFKNHLLDSKSTLLPKISDELGFGKKIIMMSTWDEFGEGHYMCPTEESGFDQLDAIREVFIGGTHTDVVPTDSQKDRINNLYPSDRTTLVREQIVSKTVPTNANLKQTINGNNNYTMLAGTASNNNGTLELKADSSGAISLNFEDLGIDINDVTHIRLRLKNSSSAYQGNFYYTTNFIQGFDGHKKLNFGIDKNMTAYTTVVLPVSTYPQHWKGILDGIRLDFTTSASEKIYIDAIQLWAVPFEGDVLANDGGRYDNYSFIEKDGKLYVPVKWLDETDKTLYYYNKNTKLFTAKNTDGRIASSVVGSKEISVGNETWQTDTVAIIYENDEFYLSPSFVAYGLNNEVDSDLETRVLTIKQLASGNNNFKGEGFLISANISDNDINISPDIRRLDLKFNNAAEVKAVTVNGNSEFVSNILKVDDKTTYVYFGVLDEAERYTIDISIACGNDIINKTIKFTSGFKKQTHSTLKIGSFDLYSNYGESNEKYFGTLMNENVENASAVFNGFQNHSSDDKEIMLIIAQYEKNTKKLLDVCVKKKEMKALTSELEPDVIEVKRINDDCYVRVFLWDKNLMPQ